MRNNPCPSVSIRGKKCNRIYAQVLIKAGDIKNDKPNEMLKKLKDVQAGTETLSKIVKDGKDIVSGGDKKEEKKEDKK